MTELNTDPIQELRLLLNDSKVDPETLSSIREIEALAVRMRNILREI